jgi:hypothetical protein
MFRLVMYASPGYVSEDYLIRSLIAGKPNDWIIDVSDVIDITADAIGFIGVKNVKVKRAAIAAGKPFFHFDKGYNRDWPYWWRVSLNDAHPTNYMMQLEINAGRRAGQNWSFPGWLAGRGNAWLIAGSSEKYAAFVGAPHPTDYAAGVLAVIRQRDQLSEVIYRPKPSWREAMPINGTTFSRRRKMIQDLRRSRVTITHSSNAAFESILNGVPVVTTGLGVTSLISSNDIHCIYIPDHDEIEALLNAAAMCQYNINEIRGGLMFRHMKEVMALCL